MPTMKDPMQPADYSREYHDYLRSHEGVHGWVDTPSLAFLHALASYQSELDIRGPVCEIGVHHGRMFIGLCLARQPGERAVAVDLFDLQELNLDNSGCGDREAFEANLNTHLAETESVTILRADSLELDGPQLLKLSGNERFRLFSVDGGHTAEIASRDLATAAGSMRSDGVVILDDFFAPSWPGVTEGLFRYLASPDESTLAPVAYGHGKLYLVAPAFHEHYAAFFSQLDGLIERSCVEIAGHSVVIFNASPLIERSFRDEPSYLLNQVRTWIERAASGEDPVECLAMAEEFSRRASRAGVDEDTSSSWFYDTVRSSIEGAPAGAERDALLEKFSSALGDDPLFLVERARLHLDRGGYAEAQRDAMTALLSDVALDAGREQRAYDLLERAWGELEDEALVTASLERLSERHGASPGFTLLEGVVLYHLGHREEAHSLLKRASEHSATADRARRLLSEWGFETS